MSEDKLAQFSNQQCLNLETYKKSGQPVQTPVGFVEDNGMLYVQTMANSGKVKRIRKNPHVHIMPCSFRGKPKGSWIDGEASIADAAESERANQLLNRKYGLRKRLGDILYKLKKRKRVIIAIHI